MEIIPPFMWYPAESENIPPLDVIEGIGRAMTKTTSADEDMGQIRTAIETWVAAELDGDATALDALLADNFVGVGPRGFMLTKAQWLARYSSRDLAPTSFLFEDVQVRHYGGTAIAIGRQSQRGTFQGRDVSGELRATLVFIQSGEWWLLASVHLSPIANPV